MRSPVLASQSMVVMSVKRARDANKQVLFADQAVALHWCPASVTCRSRGEQSAVGMPPHTGQWALMALGPIDHSQHCFLIHIPDPVRVRGEKKGT